MSPSGFKLPESVLVLVHTPALEILLLERKDPKGFWQSVTGSLEHGETPLDAARRELAEETGLQVAADALLDWQHRNRFEIHTRWRHRYAPDVTHNTEHVFSLSLPSARAVRLAPDEHTRQTWLPAEIAAGKVFSWTNRDAIIALARRLRAEPASKPAQ